MEFIEGGVTAPKGFYANGVLSGIKAGRTKEELLFFLKFLVMQLEFLLKTR